MLNLLQGIPDVDLPLPIKKVPSVLEKFGFKRPHISTIYRMIRQNRLKTFVAYGHRYTTIRAVAESAENQEPQPEASTNASADAAAFLSTEGM